MNSERLDDRRSDGTEDDVSSTRQRHETVEAANGQDIQFVSGVSKLYRPNVKTQPPYDLSRITAWGWFTLYQVTVISPLLFLVPVAYSTLFGRNVRPTMLEPLALGSALFLVFNAWACHRLLWYPLHSQRRHTIPQAIATSGILVYLVMTFGIAFTALIALAATPVAGGLIALQSLLLIPLSRLFRQRFSVQHLLIVVSVISVLVALLASRYGRLGLGIGALAVLTSNLLAVPILSVVGNARLLDLLRKERQDKRIFTENLVQWCIGFLACWLAICAGMVWWWQGI